MSRWLLVGEGPTELGSADRSGFLQMLAGQLADDDDPSLVKTLQCDAWAPMELPKVFARTGAELARSYPLDAPRPKGMAKIAARAIRAARALDCSAVVVLVDNDHQPERGKRARREQLVAGFGDSRVPRALGVAKEMLEAWLLADDGVFPVTVCRGKAPEELWGKPDDADGDHPKQVFRRAIAEAGIGRRQALEGWSVARAAPRAPWLRDFCHQIVELLREQAPRRPREADLT